MKYATRTKAAGGQKWHRIREKNPGIRTVGLDDPSFIQREIQPVPDLREKQAMKEAVRAESMDYPKELVTVVPAGKSGKKRNKRRK